MHLVKEYNNSKRIKIFSRNRLKPTGEYMLSIPVKCSVITCDKDKRCAGYCWGHYERYKKYNDTLDHIPIQERNLYKQQYPYEYQIWSNIKARILVKTSKYYKNYGGRGLTIEQEWSDSFKQFLLYIKPRPNNSLTLDRINNDLGYVKGNIRWADRTTQARNKRARVENKYGIKGIFPVPTGYIVRITVDYKRINIGTYKTLEEAISARLMAESVYWNE